MSTNIDTDGGMSNKGDAAAGRDFVGRDIVNNYVDPNSLTQDEKLNRIYRYILGDPFDGLIGQVELMRRMGDRMERMEAAAQTQAQNSKERQQAISEEVKEYRQEVEARFVVLYLVLAGIIIVELFLILRILN